MTLRPVRASNIEPVDVGWLWLDRIPLCGVTALQGEGGLGKGLTTVWLAAQLSRGTLAGSITQPGNSLIISLEDTREVLQARLAAAGADLDRIEIDDGSALDLLADADTLIAYMRRRRVRLLTLDPLHAIVRSISFDVRRVLLKVTHATRAAALVVNHLNGGRGDARSRGLGGRGLQDLSRATHVLVPHPDDGEANDGLRILAPLKLNGAPKPRSLAGHVVVVGGTPVWEWIAETDYTVDDLLARRRIQARPTPQLDEATAFLRAELAGGPAPALEVQRRAVERGIAAITLRDAREAIGVVPQRVGFGPGSHLVWTSPPTQARPEVPATRPPTRPPSPPPPTPAPAAAPARPPTPSDIDAHVGEMSIYEDDAATRFSLLELDLPPPPADEDGETAGR